MLFNEIFDTEPSVHVSCPGRVEFLGNHNDYNGGSVMGFATEQRIDLFASKRSDNKVCLYSDLDEKLTEYNLNNLPPKQSINDWTAYPIAVLVQLINENLSASSGLNIFVTSNLPYCSGLGSSGALMIASGIVYKYLYDFYISALELARVCNRAENCYIGTRSGILDQAVCACSEPNCITLVDSHDLQVENIPFEEEIAFWIFTTNNRLELNNPLYSERHDECLSALKKLQVNYAHRDHLVQYSLEELDMYSDKLTYHEYKRAIHIISENQRVNLTAKFLKEGNLNQVGILLSASHQSSKDNFENSHDELDFLVSRLLDKDKVYGARLSGGSFGGSVIAMTDKSCKESYFSEILQSYEKQFSSLPNLTRTKLGSGPSVSFSLEAKL